MMYAKTKKTEQLLERDIDGETLVLSPGGTLLHSFAGTGRSIWKLLDGERTEEEILAAIMMEYEVELEVAKTDLTEFLKDLERLKLIAFRALDQ